MRRRRLESDADRCCGRDRRHSGGFFLRIMPPSWHPVPACTPRLCCMRNCSTLRRRRLESDADRCCGRNSRHSGGFLLRIMPPSWHPVPACAPRRLCCRRAVLRCGNGLTQAELFYLRQRKLDSDAERCCGRGRRHSGGFYLGLCRLRGILSPPALHDCAAGGPFYFAATALRRRNCSICGKEN